jgi:hypothetical protein
MYSAPSAGNVFRAICGKCIWHLLNKGFLPGRQIPGPIFHPIHILLRPQPEPYRYTRQFIQPELLFAEKTEIPDIIGGIGKV